MEAELELLADHGASELARHRLGHDEVEHLRVVGVVQREVAREEGHLYQLKNERN